jgi:hypothetical protein
MSAWESQSAGECVLFLRLLLFFLSTDIRSAPLPPLDRSRSQALSRRVCSFFFPLSLFFPSKSALFPRSLVLTLKFPPQALSNVRTRRRHSSTSTPIYTLAFAPLPFLLHKIAPSPISLRSSRLEPQKTVPPPSSNNSLLYTSHIALHKNPPPLSPPLLPQSFFRRRFLQVCFLLFFRVVQKVSFPFLSVILCESRESTCLRGTEQREKCKIERKTRPAFSQLQGVETTTEAVASQGRALPSVKSV